MSAVPLYDVLRDRWNGGATVYQNLATEVVKRGRFRITVVERGTLASSKNATLSSGVEGQTTIISIIPEGTAVRAPLVAEAEALVEKISPRTGDQVYITLRGTDGATTDVPVLLGKYTRVLVKEGRTVEPGQMLAGDVCCELDSALLVEKEIQQRILVTQAESALKKAEENVQIQELQNATDQATAQLTLDLAQLDLRKFLEGDSIQAEREIQAELKLAQQTLAQAEESYNFMRRNAKKGFNNQNQLESERIKMQDAKLKVDIAMGKLEVLTKYTNDRTEKELSEKAEEAVRALERVRRAGAAALAQYKADLEAAKLTYEAEKGKLARLEQQIAACNLVAPQDGKVVYANVRSRRSEPVVIEEGATVRERQAVIYLPDFSQMKVDAKIHESKISPLRPGQPAIVRVDSLPGRTFRGVVKEIPDVPVPGDWPNSDLMLYPVEVTIAETVEDLKPGMSADVQIVVDDRDDVLQVPVQAIIAVGTRYVAFVLTPNGPELREDVKIGESNDSSIEVLAGLEEGERVVMNPRTQFADQLAELEAKYGKAQRQPGQPDAPGPQPEGTATAAGPGGAAAGETTRRPQAGAAGAGFTPETAMQRADKNGDGKISKDEWTAPVPFEQADTDGDGAVTLEELKAGFARRAAAGAPAP